MPFEWNDRTLAHAEELRKNPPIGSLRRKQFTLKQYFTVETTVAVILAIIKACIMGSVPPKRRNEIPR